MDFLNDPFVNGTYQSGTSLVNKEGGILSDISKELSSGVLTGLTNGLTSSLTGNTANSIGTNLVQNLISSGLTNSLTGSITGTSNYSNLLGNTSLSGTGKTGLLTWIMNLVSSIGVPLAVNKLSGTSKEIEKENTLLKEKLAKSEQKTFELTQQNNLQIESLRNKIQQLEVAQAKNEARTEVILAQKNTSLENENRMLESQLANLTQQENQTATAEMPLTAEQIQEQASPELSADPSAGIEADKISENATDQKKDKIKR